MSSLGWGDLPLAECVVSINAGVSVNSEDRPRSSGEIGVLKTSAISRGSFLADENKVIVTKDRLRVAEPLLSGSVLLSRMNTPSLVGESCYVESGDQSLFLPDRLWQIRADASRVDTRWLSYVLQSPRVSAAIKALATGTSGTMKNISKKSLLALRISVPSLSEQNVIAEILGELDDQIRKTGQALGKLSLIKQGMAYDEFLSHRNETLLRLDDIAEIGSGNTPSRANPTYWTRGAIPWVKTAEINSGLIESAEERVTPAALSGTGLRVFPIGTILIAMYGQGSTRGRAALLGLEACVNQACAALTLREDRVDPTYLFQFLLSNYDAIRSLGQGSNQTNLSASLLGGLMVPLPPIEEQRQVGAALQSVDTKARAERRQLDKLQVLKAGLVSDLLTGRVRVLAEVAP